jgi:hypothetical protein
VVTVREDDHLAREPEVDQHLEPCHRGIREHTDHPRQSRDEDAGGPSFDATEHHPQLGQCDDADEQPAPRP